MAAWVMQALVGWHTLVMALETALEIWDMQVPVFQGWGMAVQVSEGVVLALWPTVAAIWDTRIPIS